VGSQGRRDREDGLAACAASACFYERTLVLELLVLGGGILELTRKKTHETERKTKICAAETVAVLVDSCDDAISLKIGRRADEHMVNFFLHDLV
jgi:hypothetical protein